MKINLTPLYGGEMKIMMKRLIRFKVLLFLFILFSSFVWSITFSQTITITVKNKGLTELFKEIKEQTGYNIIYNNQLVSRANPVSINAQDMPIAQFLDLILDKNNLSYVISGQNILIKKKENSRQANASKPEDNREAKLQEQITGQVKDENGKPLAAVSITNKTLNSSTSTDANGKFQINARLQDILVFSFIGFERQERSVNNLNPIQVVLVPSESQLSEVVVTALGIKREEKAIGFAQQTVNAEQLATAASPSWSDGLKGKVAGLNIISGGTGPINSQSIQLRGATSLDPSSNYALIVIDGVPMNQESTPYIGNVSAAYGNEAPVDYGNAVSELRQEDIESVSVLKGPSAAALYGSRAANGALIITTKSGKKNQKLGISYNSSLNLDAITNWPDYQYEYGAGTIGNKDVNGNPYYSFGVSPDGPSTNTPEAYGPKFDGQYFYQYDPNTQNQGTERTLWKPYKNNMKDFFRTGTTFENAVSFQGGDSRGSMRVNIAHAENAYITPNSGYKRNAVAFNGNYQITNRIKASASVNYNNRSSDNLPAFGISNGSLGYFLMFLMPNVDINWYKPIWQNGKENLEQLNPFSAWSSNPYYILNIDQNPLTSNQIVGNTKVDIKITDNWDVMGRVSMNSLSQLRETQRGFSSKKHLKGYYGRQDVASQEYNMDFLTTYKNSFADHFNYSIMGGGSRMDYTMRNMMSSVDALIVPGVYTLANGVNNPLTNSNDSRKQINSLYGMGSLAWKDRVFVDVTARNDWSSSLPLSNNSYFYPSVSSSFILSDLLELPKSISYLKYRASYAVVGADANPYQTARYFSQSGFPSSATVPGTLFNADLKPEITSSWETGVDMKFLKNRLGFDLTYYNSITKNQILALPSDIVAGYSSRVINAGEVQNRGWELIVNATPIQRENFDWQVIANWSTNDNTILSLTDNLEKQTLATVWQAYLIGTVGGSTTDLWGTKFIRDPAGNIVYNKGVPMKGTTPEYIGNTAPDYKFGLTNTFKYQGIRLSFTFDGQIGGRVFSGTYNRASWAGTLKNTLPGRDEGVIIGEGVEQLTDGSYKPNETEINTQTYYSQYHQITEAGVFSGSFLKFRELTIGYNFPKSMLKSLRIDGLSLNFFGRNLAIFDNYPMFDPEAGTKNGAVYVPGLEITPMPHTSSYGFNLKVDF
ncbi:SusC/RagA family TonB-linked outer membrane protein [Sphingobacterium humi]|uniref:SusC/RagA family TonB-linked outer membrane protein n=1 Tax=Sphingobacterium humi TaxID=1796905 RepID=A0A6N8L2G0_9SPHI|nr:SusC/RagA family TonB-linked outer membrane protein [Sphingobacterium humi]MVZ63925.1 SusC/RagA family TonB-linked outer membrane protein [Sphingobacterium humi]